MEKKGDALEKDATPRRRRRRPQMEKHGKDMGEGGEEEEEVPGGLGRG